MGVSSKPQQCQNQQSGNHSALITRLFDKSSDGIFRIDRNLKYQYANAAISSMLGVYAGRYICEMGDKSSLSNEMEEAWIKTIRKVFESGEEQTIEYHSTRGQRSYSISASLLPETSNDGHIHSVLGIVYDVSKRERMEKEHEILLNRERNARIQAEMAARARDEFLAIVSHELRAPLNGIQTWAHVLESNIRNSPVGTVAKRALNGIKTGIHQQVRLIEDLLDVTRMMSGKLRLIKHPFTLLPMIHSAIQSIQDHAVQKHIRIHSDLQITTEQMDGDSDRVQQIMWNLLSNAVKFTPPDGDIWISAESDDSYAKITIRDNGAGISSEFLPHLFDRFSQADTSITRRHSGLGLGLFIVKHLSELHGGSVFAESNGENTGAAFTINLPLRDKHFSYISALQSETGELVGPFPSLNGLRILLVDDQEEARESLSIVLTNAGAKVQTATSSMEIFVWLRTLQDNELPNIVVSDIAMPHEDGYTVLNKLRSWKLPDGRHPLQHTPALALTAFAQREDRIKALTSGFQMHMTKPVSPEELIVVIAMMSKPR